MTSHKYEFLYFPVKGFGNLSRIILEDQGVAYDFKPVTDNWPQLKPTTPLGQVPVLTVDGTHKIAQSHTIARYLGRELGLMGSNSLEQAQVEMWIDQTADLRKKFSTMIYSNYENGLKPFLEGLPSDLEVFDKQLAASGDGGKHLLWGKVTVADYLFFDLLHFLHALNATSLDHNPHVKAFFESFGAREKLHAFLNRADIKAMKFTGSPHL